jgi:transposase
MDSLEERLLVLESALRHALAENAVLRARVAELERQLGLTSTTSSKPPSSDGYKKPPRRTESLRGQTPKDPKPPKPRDRTHLEASATPNTVVVLPPLHQCPCCQKDIADVARSGVVKRQVFDIPEPKIHVTEFQGEVKVCSCGETVSNFPAHMTAPVQYGSRLKSVMVYLSNQHFIPEDRLRQACEDMFGVALCGKTLANFNRQAAEALAEDDKRRFETVKASLVKHADETGMRIEGKLQWVHTLSDGDTTHYRVGKRGAMPVGVTGTLVHDCLGSDGSLKVTHADETRIFCVS